jgi:translation initiation factor IF-2
MGHVDHGKTTLLDYIRKTNIAAREAGGITQAIGAYEIEHNNRKITFVDTPGHEAFSNMRAYGANVADLAVLIVAADDGVKPQTKEALETIVKSNTPYIVAINKIDKNNADIEGTKKSLLQIGVFLEGYGGNVSYQLISAKTGEGINELLDLISLATELENLETDPNMTSGIIITSRRDPRRGILAGVILKSGTLKTGQLIGTASASGKIKAMENSIGEKASELHPSAPALITGFDAIPQVGEEFLAGDAEAVEEFVKNKKLELQSKISENATTAGEGELMKLILKADETASLEALKSLVLRIPLGLSIKIINANVGDVTENDVKLALNTGAVLVGFKTKIDKAASNLAINQKVALLESPIIYELEKSIRDYAKKMVPKEMRRLEILAVFGEAKGKERVVGGKVILGPIKNQEPFEIWHDKKLLGRGKIMNLQSQRKDIQEAEIDKEVGLLVSSDESIKVGYQLIFSDEE